MKFFGLILSISLLLNGIQSDYGADVYNRILNYNPLVQPYKNITVSISVDLSDIIDVDMKNQIMTTKLHLHLRWRDALLGWSIKQYPGLDSIHLPASKIWTPNIILWNRLDATTGASQGEVFISSTGEVHQSIPATFKSTCTIDPTYYPFDQQTCVLKFGSVSTSSDVRLKLYEDVAKMNLEYYSPSVSWDVIEVPAFLNVYPVKGTDTHEVDVTYYLTTRRKTNCVHHVYPALAFAFLSILPLIISKSLEKLILQLACLAGLCSMYADNLRKLTPTTLVTPLIFKYLVALITLNMIHLTFSCVIGNVSKNLVDRLANRIPQEVFNSIDKIQNMIPGSKKLVKANTPEVEDVETDQSQEVKKERNAGAIVLTLLNVINSTVVILGVIIASLCYLTGSPTPTVGPIA